MTDEQSLTTGASRQRPRAHPRAVRAMLPVPDGARRFISGRWPLLFALLLLVLTVRSFMALAQAPPGLYTDEASVGYNAWAVGNHGRDEHGIAFPLYFEAFGEWKNPVYIYVLAGLLRFMALTPSTVRIPAAIFGIITALSITAVAWRLTRSHGITAVTLLLCTITPWLVLESRLGFESSALLACLSVALLCLVWSEQNDSPWMRAGAGLALALGIFAYSTARVEIALLMVVFAVALRWWPRQWRRWLPVVSPVAAGYLVLLVWMHAHPGALTSRFSEISIFHGITSWFDVVWRFARNYISYLNLPFLFATGDANPRHNTQFEGMLPITATPIALAGLFACWQQRDRPLAQLVVLGLLAAPISAALTSEGSPHSLRANTMLPFLLLLMVFGLHWLWPVLSRRRTWVGLAVALLVAEGGAYTWDLFTAYPARAAAYFDDGQARALAAAGRAAGEHNILIGVSLSRDGTPIYIQVLFALDLPPPDTYMALPGYSVLPQHHVFIVTDSFLTAPSAGDVVVVGPGDDVPPHAQVIDTERAPGGGAAEALVYLVH